MPGPLPVGGALRASAVKGPRAGGSLTGVGSKWFSRRACLIHLTAIIVIPACAFLAWWQTTRALDGNALSWAYAVEWPVFAVYGTYLWWKLIHDGDRRATAADVAAGVVAGAPDEETGGVPGTVRADRSTERGEVADWTLVEDEEDPELAAYNRYLAKLSSGGSRKHW